MPSRCQARCLVPRLGLLGLLALLILAPSFTAAQERSNKTEQTSESPVSAQYRLWANSIEARQSLDQRLRLRLDLDRGPLQVVLESDFLSGQLVGDPMARIPTGADTGTELRGGVVEDPTNIVDPRQAYVEYTNPNVGQLQVGLQTSQWGLGVLANSGATRTESLFNDHVGGDRVFRALFGTKPLMIGTGGRTNSSIRQNLILAVGGDVVFRDENAALIQGDRAYQGVFALLYDSADLRLGHYITFRSQRDRDGDYLRAAAIDFYVDRSWRLQEWDLRLGAETTILTGETDRTRVAAGDRRGRPADVQAVGTAAELEATWRAADVHMRLLGGYASGDADPDDDTIYRFRFDPNYQVGLVLFDHYLPAQTRRSWQRLHDPTQSAEAPKGTEGLVNTGSVANALYLNPQVMFGDPQDDGLATGLGALWARSAVPLYDPYASFANGGYPSGLNGRQPAARALGWEVDVAARYRWTLDMGLSFEAKGEFGLLFPGAAFADASGSRPAPVSLLRARLAAIF